MSSFGQSEDEEVPSHPADPLNPPTKDMESYWLALGRFVHEFAHIEKFLHAIIIQLAHIPLNTGQAFLNGSNVDQMIGLLKRILIATRADEQTKKEMDAVVDQLGMIRTLRNNILHYGTQFNAGDQFVVSNAHKQHTPEKTWQIVVSVDVLNRATADLEKISSIFTVYFVRGWTDEVIDRLPSDKKRLAAWQYKPLSPAPPHQGPDKNPRSKRQRKSSQA